MSEPIAITGANGAAGQALLRLAEAERLTVVAVVRSQKAAEAIDPSPRSRVAVIAYDRPETLEAALTDCTSLIHLPGILIERPGTSYEQSHVETTRAALAAAHRCGLRKIVLISAIGADPDSRNRYYRSKGQAERLVVTSRIPYCILRVPLLLGPGTAGIHGIIRQAKKRVAFLPGGSRQIQQPLDLQDLARGALRAARYLDVARSRVLDLVGPTALSERALIERVARGLNRAPRLVPIPVVPMRAWLALRTRVLGPGFSPDVLEVIHADTKIEAQPAAQELGIRLTPLEQTLKRVVLQEEQL